MRISQLKEKLLLTLAYLCAVAIFYIFKLPCVFQKYIGIPCPGCGMTRAILCAIQLDLVAAFQHHPMFWSPPILYAYFLLDFGIFPQKRYNKILLWAIFAGFVFNWAAMILDDIGIIMSEF